MPSSMAMPDLYSVYELAITIAQKLLVIFLKIHVKSLGIPVVFVEIMVQKMSM